MKLKVLGSSSHGNGYILENDTEALILEAGIHPKEVKKALGFNISKIVGIVITHEHGDHADYYRDYLKLGCSILSNENVYIKKGCALMPPWAHIMEAGKGYKIGHFKIIPFDVKHDVPCFGLLIEHPDMGKLLFVTDTMMLEFTFRGLNHIMLEVNYADDIIDAKIMNGEMPSAMRPRLTDSHMELNTAKNIIMSNDLSEVSDIILIHLSEGNSQEERFKSEISEVSGKPVYVAVKGLIIDLSTNPY